MPPNRCVSSSVSSQRCETLPPVVVAVDPGRVRCGIAVVPAYGPPLARHVGTADAAADEVVRLSRRYRPVAVLLGNGTGSDAVLRRVRDLAPELRVEVVDESRTSEEARRRWFVERPPRGWRRLVPRGLLIPDAPYDDLVAVILAERWWAAQGSQT